MYLGHCHKIIHIILYVFFTFQEESRSNTSHIYSLKKARLQFDTVIQNECLAATFLNELSYFE